MPLDVIGWQLASRGFFGDKEKRKMKKAGRAAAKKAVSNVKKITKKHKKNPAKALRILQRKTGSWPTAGKGGYGNPGANKLGAKIKYKAPKIFK